MTDELLVALRPHVTIDRWEDGECIAALSKSERKVVLVYSGCASVERCTAEGQQVGLYLRPAGQLIGADAFFSSQNHDIEVVAVGQTETASLTISVLAALIAPTGPLCKWAPAIRERMTKDLLQSVEDVYDRVTELVSCSATELVEDFLTQLSKVAGIDDQVGRRFPGDVRLIHAYTGVSRETIRRVREQWLRDGRVLVGYRGQLILPKAN